MDFQYSAKNILNIFMYRHANRANDDLRNGHLHDRLRDRLHEDNHDHLHGWLHSQTNARLHARHWNVNGRSGPTRDRCGGDARPGNRYRDLAYRREHYPVCEAVHGRRVPGADWMLSCYRDGQAHGLLQAPARIGRAGHP